MVTVDDAFALHITWTTYGSWLPGGERGYVSNTLVPGKGYEKKHNVPGTPITADDGATRERAQALQKWPTVFLTAAEALVAAQSLVESARARGWRIIRGAIMANHVHILVTDCPDDGPQVRRVLKGSSQAKLSEVHGSPRVWWTTAGSDRYKHGQLAIETANDYIANQEFKLAEIIDTQASACVIDSRSKDKSEPRG
jgi:REP element-mobilizing transposase RayT